MKDQARELDFTGEDIYIGIDVHVNSWTVAIYTSKLYHKTFSQAAQPEPLVRYLHRHFPGGHYHGVYEAGYCGFWIYEALMAAGIDMMVINPADVPTTGHERVYKHDRADASKLARSLRAGELRGIYVPSRDVLEDRQLVRTRSRLVSKQTRVKNQIKALLRHLGINIPETFARRHWSRPFIQWLRTLADIEDDTQTLLHQSGALTLKLHLDELQALRAQILEVTRAIRRLAHTERYRTDVEHLVTIRGIGLISAMVLITELVDINRFTTLDRLASFVGLVPSKKSSGDHDPTQRLTTRRSAALRHILIESAWVAVRRDPRLIQDFHRLAKRMKKTDAIIRIARKQLNRIRFVLKNKTPYIPMPLAA